MITQVMPDIDLAAYFSRIAYSGPRQPNLAVLQALPLKRKARQPLPGAPGDRGPVLQRAYSCSCCLGLVRKTRHQFAREAHIGLGTGAAQIVDERRQPVTWRLGEPHVPWHYRVEDGAT